MSRKIKSIFLLLIFLALVVHEMIPHHHHEHATDSDTILSQHTKTGCHSGDLAGFVHSECEIQESISVDNNHECPHHLHNCSINNLEFNSTNNSISLRQWNQSTNIITSELKNSISIYSACTKHAYSNIPYHLNKLLKIGAISLRAPPVLG